MYATASELRGQIDQTSTADDTVLEAILRAATRTIDRFCNRPDGFLADVAASARYYVGSGNTIQRIDECAIVSAVAVKDSASDDEGDYTAWTVGMVGSTTGADVFPASGDPEAPDYNSTPYVFMVIGANGDYSIFTDGTFTTRGGFKPSGSRTRGTPTVQVTARWGYAITVPDDIKQACIMQATRWYKRLQSSMGDSIASTEFGQLLYRQSLDPDIRLILEAGRYVRPAVGRRY